MNCDRTRELLLELEPATFDEVEHLRTCTACRAFADQLRAADGGTAAERVEAQPARRAAYVTVGIVVALSATVLLWVIQPQERPIPQPAPVVASPTPAPPAAVPPPPPVEEPAPALPVPTSPSPPVPVAAPRVVTPRRVRAPRPAVEPAPLPVEEPSLAAPPVTAGGSIVVRISPNLPGIYSASLKCGSSGSFASRSWDVLRFDKVGEGPCKIVFLGTDGISTPVSTGTWLLTRVNGVTLLVLD